MATIANAFEHMGGDESDRGGDPLPLVAQTRAAFGGGPSFCQLSTTPTILVASMLPHEDERIRALDDILRTSSVPIGTKIPGGFAGPSIFVLGSLERRVTVYAQQIRALNLITAVHERGNFPDGLTDKRVMVIGTGVAGATAALAAARHGATVFAVDRNHTPFKNLLDSNRWLHPRIYDWPNPGWNADIADLPYLDWKAGSCAEVGRQLTDHWNRALAKNERLKFLGNTTEIAIERREQAGKKLTDHTVKLNHESKGAFHVIILALGFGREIQFDGHTTPSYWEDFAIAGDKILVAGCGDGGLLDAIRACKDNFIQSYLQDFAFEGHDELEREVAQIEFELSQNRISPEELPSRYNALPYIEAFDRFVLSRSRPSTKVHVAAQEAGMMSPNASPLHRLIASRLLWRGQLTHIRSRVTKVEPVASDRFLVSFHETGTYPAEDFAKVIARLGPASALKAFSPEIHDAVAAKFPVRGGHRLPLRLWVRASIATASGTAAGRSSATAVAVAQPATPPALSSAARDDAGAAEIRRTMTVGDDGIVDVAVQFKGFHGARVVVLAAPGGTIANIEPEGHAIIDGQFQEQVNPRDQDTVRYELLVPSAAAETITWGYRATNGLAMNRAETAMFQDRKRRGPRLNSGWERWSYHLNIKTERLVLELAYPATLESFYSEALPSVERRNHGSGDLAWETAGDEQARCLLSKTANVLRLECEQPRPGHRYGIKYKLSSPGAPLLDATRDILGLAVKYLRRTKHEGDPARAKLDRDLRSVVALHGRCREEDLDREDLRIIAMLWDIETKQLIPIGGVLPPGAWASQFSYGVGVAGHAFRFCVPVAWYVGDHARSSVIKVPSRQGQPDDDWILCFPIFAAYPREAMGVVSISGSDAAIWNQLNDRARSSTAPGVLEANWQLTYDLNVAFWATIEATWSGRSWVQHAKQRHDLSWPANGR